MGLDFRTFGKAAFLQFREDEFAVDGDLETAAVGRNDDALRDVLLFFFEDCLRQTDGFGEIASTGAVFNFDFRHVL